MQNFITSKPFLNSIDIPLMQSLPTMTQILIGR